VRFCLSSIASFALALLLSGCGSNSTATISAVSANASALCVASSCGTKTKLLDIPSAENILFTPEGRLFVSGGTNVFEITRDTPGWHARPLASSSGNFTGLAQIGNVLYANCFDGNLYAAVLTATPSLLPIHALGLTSPNGLSTGQNGELYVVNGPLSSSSPPNPKIVRLKLDPANPLHVIEQTDWLTTGLSFPNGIQRRGNTLFFSDSTAAPPQLGLIKSVQILADGSAGVPQIFASFNGLPDDFSFVGDKIVAASYSNGQIILIGADGQIQSQTNPMSFDTPSGVRQGQAPLFSTNELLITEKGVVGLPPTPGYGNALSVFRPNGT
jgi:hypothetical protein